MNTDHFGNLLKPHYNDLLNYCRALCANKSEFEAEEILQQSLLTALEKRNQLEDESRFRSWMFKIVTHTFYNTIKKPFWKKMLVRNTQSEEEWPRVYSEVNYDDHELIIKALATLNEQERAALLLFEIGGFKQKEIQHIQGEKSESAIKSRLSRARTKLKHTIENEDHSASLATSYEDESEVVIQTSQLITNIQKARTS